MFLKKYIISFLILQFVSQGFICAQQNNQSDKSNVGAYAPVNGIKMYYETYGNGSMPLILIHGGGSTIQSTFGNMIPMLSKHIKLIAVELQAHGRTSDRDEPESFEQDADDVAALLKYLEIGKANFLGFSNGGTTTLQIAIRHPELVNKIIPVSCNFKRDGMIPGFFEMMKNATLKDMPMPLQEAYLKVAPDKTHLQTMFEKDRQRMLHFQDIPDQLISSVKFPVLLMVADHDVVTTEHVLQMSHLIPNAKLVVLPGVHGSFLGESETVVKGSRLTEMSAILVEEFLNE